MTIWIWLNRYQIVIRHAGCQYRHLASFPIYFISRKFRQKEGKMDLTYLINPLLIMCGITFAVTCGIWAFMVVFEAGYDAGYQSGKRNFKHALRSEASRVFEN